MSVPLTLIVAGEPAATRAALSAGCAAMRAYGGAVAVAQLVPVVNPVLLGDPHVYWALTAAQQDTLDGYVASARDYGLNLSVYAMQCVDRRGAILDLIELLRPETAFVAMSSRGPLWWRQWRFSTLASAVAARGCRLLPLSDGPQMRAQASPLSSGSAPAVTK
jgi:hypothetical protein